LAVVKIAFDDISVDVPLRQRPRTVGAGVIGDIELAVDIENGHRQTGGFDPKRRTGGDLFGFA
jgi:hypothetical protein